MKESELLADLASRVEVISDAPEIIESEQFGITRMLVSYFETGKSEKLQLPVAIKKNIGYYVKDRGELTEEAWYQDDEPKITSERDPVDAALEGNLLTAALYTSSELRKKLLGQLCSSSQAVFWESVDTENHVERKALSMKVLRDPNTYVNVFMSFVALDTVVRTKGASATDADIATAVNGWWTNVAVTTD
jgi:hypothetical protein